MTRQARSLAQLTGAIALMAATYAFAVTTPAHQLTQQQRTAAGLMVLVGALLAPSALIVGAARDAQA